MKSGAKLHLEGLKLLEKKQKREKKKPSKSDVLFHCKLNQNLRNMIIAKYYLMLHHKH